MLLLALFGFMDLLIIVKWLTDYSELPGAKPPSIISQMIVMCLRFGEPDPASNETPLIDNQTQIMQLLMMLALISAPIMLFVKPIYEHSKQGKNHNNHHVADDNNERFAVNPTDSQIDSSEKEFKA